ncbi:MAG: MFS transporter [Clostridia bacterium]|nr:MFS transporter [Clostridia bacterium]
MPHKGIVSRKLFTCLFLLYVLNVFGKIAFSAVTVELVDAEIMTKTQAGLVNAAFWFAYAAGQMFGGIVASKMSPYRMLSITLLSSFAANALIVVFDSFVPILILWTINGFMQFGMWPAILRIVATDLLPTHRTKGLARMGYCYAIGSIISYLLTSGILLILPWQSLFAACAIVNLGSLVFVYLMSKRYAPIIHTHLHGTTELKPVVEAPKTPKAKLTFALVWGSGLIFFTAIVFFRNLTDTCIKNWMPTILTETYGASPSFTLLLSVVLLIINIFGVIFCSMLYKKLKRDEARTIAVLFLVALPMTVLLLNFKSFPMLVTTLLMILITMVVNSTGQVTAMFYTSRFQAFGLTAFVGGFVNAFAALGNVAASYGGGYLADNFGWNAVILGCLVLVIACLVLSIAVIPIWKKFRQKNP